eukprot:403376461
MEASKAKQKKSGGAARKSQSNAQKNSITNYFGKAASKGTDLGLPMVQDSKMHLKNEDNVQRQSQQSVKTRSQKQDEDEEMKMEGVEPIDQSQYSQSINEEVNFGELLKEMGYQFTGQDQELRQLKTNDRFEFSNQDEYDYLCQLIIGYIQQQMIQKYGMVEVMIPEDEAGPKCNIFVSQNYFDDSVNKCFVIIQGTGEVRAGMWSRRVCINDNLNLGSMLPQIEWALSQGFKVIVFNPNMRKDPRFGQNIKNCQTMSSHCLYVWEKYVSPLKCKHLAVLAHSAGGRCKKIFQEKQKLLSSQIPSITVCCKI